MGTAKATAKSLGKLNGRDGRSRWMDELAGAWDRHLYTQLEDMEGDLANTLKNDLYYPSEQAKPGHVLLSPDMWRCFL